MPNEILWAHKPQLVEIKRPDSAFRAGVESEKFPFLSVYPEELFDLTNDMTDLQFRLFIKLVAWCFIPMVEGPIERPFPSLPLMDDPHSFHELLGVSREVWKENSKAVLSRFEGTTDANWLVPPQAFLRWRLLLQENDAQKKESIKAVQ